MPRSAEISNYYIIQEALPDSWAAVNGRPHTSRGGAYDHAVVHYVGKAYGVRILRYGTDGADIAFQWDKNGRLIHRGLY